VRIARRFAEVATLLPEAELRETLRARSSNLAFVERIIGKNELMSAGFLIKGSRVCRSVGRVVIRSGSGSVLGYGTGFLISPRLLITNNHVLADASEAANSTVQFDFVEVDAGQQQSITEVNLLPSTFFATDVHLDYTVVAIEPPSGGDTASQQRGWSPLVAPSGKLIVGEPVNVIQHPGGQLQQISIRENEIVDVVGDFLHYAADTLQGSSGALVANDQWQVGALHHAGVPKRDGDDILLIGGGKWDRTSATAHLIHWVANEGVRISRIVEDLNQKITDPGRTQLLRNAFQPPADLEVASPPHADGHSGLGSLKPRIQDNKATFTIPLELSIGLPQFGSTADASPAPTITGPSNTPPPKSTPQGDSATAISSTMLDSALSKLSLSEAAVYYDEDQDSEAIDDYYADIADDADLVGEELFRKLSEKLKDSHHTRLSYRRARLDHLYPNIDLRENGELQSIYSGDGMSAEEVIRTDVAIEMRLEKLMRERFPIDGMSEEQYEVLAEAFESSAGINCEHVVCQSWFDKRQPMKADMHHLFSCEPGCNSFRSNIPYFQFGPQDEARREHCGRREQGNAGDSPKFEPTAGKGAVARATLYFLLRYPGEIGEAIREMQLDRLGVLIDWHNEFEVSVYEKHRNAEIFKVQGNRNPLIDFPEWAEHIAFELGFNN